MSENARSRMDRELRVRAQRDAALAAAQSARQRRGRQGASAPAPLTITERVLKLLNDRGRLTLDELAELLLGARVGDKSPLRRALRRMEQAGLVACTTYEDDRPSEWWALPKSPDAVLRFLLAE